MLLQFTASKDTYITNKIVPVGGGTRATDANVGLASTLDIFKLYGETAMGDSTAKTEISRALISFNVADISSSLKDKVSFDADNFKCTLKLYDVQGSSVAPSNFNLIALIILLRSCPALPTNGMPCASSSLPGASPINITFASRLPS